MAQAVSPPKLDFGNFTVDFDRGAVVRDGRTIFLRPQSFRVLCHLLEHRGQLVTKEELFREVWGDSVVTDDSLTQCLVEIRKALGKKNRGLVKTMPRRGYIFEGMPAESPGASSTVHESSPSRTLIGAGLVLVTVVGLLLYWLADDPDSAPVQPVAESRPAVVAVLPFKDFTQSGENDYLGYGLAEETLNRLTLVPGLRVIARTSSFAMAAEENPTMGDLSRRLGATHAVEGSVREHDDTLRITAQLIETSTGYHLWSESFDRQTHDLLRVQDEIASAITGVLRLSTEGQPSGVPAISAADYDLYLRASYLLTARGLASLQEARPLLEYVVERNPHHLPSIEKLFWVYRHQFLVRELDEDAAVSLIEGLAQSLAGFEPAALIVQTALGEKALQIQGDLTLATEHLGAALTLSTQKPPTLRAAGELARALGRFDDAIALYQAALATDPLCSTCYHNLAYANLMKGSLDDAERAIREFMKLTRGGHFSLALVKTLQGEFEAAGKVLDQPVPPKMQGYRDFYLALLSFAEGDRQKYLELREQFEQNYAETEAIRLAQLYAWGDDLSEANDWALLAADREPARLLNTLQEPVWAGLREDDRFLQLLARFGRAPWQLDAIDFDIDRPALADGAFTVDWQRDVSQQNSALN